MLTGCSAKKEDLLVSAWQDYEKYIYDVTNTTGDDIGQLVYISERVTKKDTTIGTILVPSATGTKISYELEIYNNEDYIKSEMLFTSNTFNPQSVYKETLISGVLTETNANYNNSKYNYAITIDGIETSSGEIKCSSPYYDNEMVYYILRSLDMKGESFSFSVPSPLEEALQNRTVTYVATVMVNSNVGSVNCDKLTMTSNQMISGTPFNLYYSTEKLVASGDPLKNYEDKIIHSALIKMEEGDYIYTLKSLTVDRPQETE